MDSLEKYPKTRDTRRAHVFHPSYMMFFFRKISQYTIQREHFVIGYSKIETYKLFEIIACSFCGALKLERA